MLGGDLEEEVSVEDTFRRFGFTAPKLAPKDPPLIDNITLPNPVNVSTSDLLYTVEDSVAGFSVNSTLRSLLSTRPNRNADVDVAKIFQLSDGPTEESLRIAFGDKIPEKAPIGTILQAAAPGRISIRGVLDAVVAKENPSRLALIRSISTDRTVDISALGKRLLGENLEEEVNVEDTFRRYGFTPPKEPSKPTTPINNLNDGGNKQLPTFPITDRQRNSLLGIGNFLNNPRNSRARFGREGDITLSEDTNGNYFADSNRPVSAAARIGSTVNYNVVSSDFADNITLSDGDDSYTDNLGNGDRVYLDNGSDYARLNVGDGRPADQGGIRLADGERIGLSDIAQIVEDNAETPGIGGIDGFGTDDSVTGLSAGFLPFNFVAVDAEDPDGHFRDIFEIVDDNKLTSSLDSGTRELAVVENAESIREVRESLPSLSFEEARVLADNFRIQGSRSEFGIYNVPDPSTDSGVSILVSNIARDGLKLGIGGFIQGSITIPLPERRNDVLLIRDTDWSRSEIDEIVEFFQ